MSWSKTSVPLNVNHYPTIAADECWQKCQQILSTIDPEELTLLFGDPINPKKYSMYWRVGKLAISGIVGPYIIAFDGAASGHDVDEIMNEIKIIHSVLHIKEQ